MNEDDLITFLLASNRAPASSPMCPYKILGVDKSASCEEIAHAYRSRSLALHPDKNPNPFASDAFVILKTAYEDVKSRQAAAKEAPTVFMPSTTLNRDTQAYHQYDATCSQLLNMFKFQEVDSRNRSGQKRKVPSPLRDDSSSRRDPEAMDVSRSDSDQEGNMSCEDDCDCGEEKCTCHEPDSKRARSEADLAPPPQQQAHGIGRHPNCPINILSTIWSRFASFMEFHPRTTSTAPIQMPPQPAPRANVCLSGFLSSQAYSKNLSSIGRSSSCGSKKSSKSKKE